MNSRICFGGDGAVVYLTSSPRKYQVKIDAYRETSVYIGANNYFNDCMSIIVSERQNVLIGSDGMFSFGIWVRTADPHLIYSTQDMRRTNMSRSVLIGDHVWLGQNSLILKGTRIGSDSVLAAAGVATGKTIASNTIFGGNPARLLKQKTFWDGSCVHNFTKERIKASMAYPNRNYIYEDKSPVDFDDFDERLKEAPDAEAKLSLLRELAGRDGEKNRFYIGPVREKGILRALRR